MNGSCLVVLVGVTVNSWLDGVHLCRLSTYTHAVFFLSICLFVCGLQCGGIYN